MNIIFKATASLLARVRMDLVRPHAFAHERVGWLTCKAATAAGGLIVLASEYVPLLDSDYVPSDRAGAMMNAAGIRRGLQAALANKASIFHIHMHVHSGRPRFSTIDLEESAKFVPDFFNVMPTMPHGTMVLSKNQMSGLCWLSRSSKPIGISAIFGVGAPLRVSGGTP